MMRSYYGHVQNKKYEQNKGKTQNKYIQSDSIILDQIDRILDPQISQICCKQQKNQEPIKVALQNITGELRTKLTLNCREQQVLKVLKYQDDNYDHFQRILLRARPNSSEHQSLRAELRQFLLQDKLNNHQLHAAQLVLQAIKHDRRYKQLYWDLYMEKFLEEVDWQRTRIQIKDLTQELHLCQKLKFQYHHRHFKGGNRTFMMNKLDMIDKSIVEALRQHPNVWYIVVQHIHGKGNDSYYEPIWKPIIQEWYTSKYRINQAYHCEPIVDVDNESGSLQVWYSNPYYVGQEDPLAYQP